MQSRAIRAVATALALVMIPSLTMAQAAGDTRAGSSVKMKGSPNANGALSGATMPADQATSAPGASAGARMKGPPNADGAPGARSPEK
jgi:hypothetical protein